MCPRKLSDYVSFVNASVVAVPELDRLVAERLGSCGATASLKRTRKPSLQHAASFILAASGQLELHKRLMATWGKLEKPKHASRLPVTAVMGMACLRVGFNGLAASLLLALFFARLRAGEAFERTSARRHRQ